MLCLGIWRRVSTSSKSCNLTLVLARAFEAMSTCSQLGCGGSGVWRSSEIWGPKIHASRAGLGTVVPLTSSLPMNISTDSQSSASLRSP